MLTHLPSRTSDSLPLRSIAPLTSPMDSVLALRPNGAESASPTGSRFVNALPSTAKDVTMKQGGDKLISETMRKEEEEMEVVSTRQEEDRVRRAGAQLQDGNGMSTRTVQEEFPKLKNLVERSKVERTLLHSFRTSHIL